VSIARDPGITDAAAAQAADGLDAPPDERLADASLAGGVDELDSSLRP